MSHSYNWRTIFFALPCVQTQDASFCTLEVKKSNRQLFSPSIFTIWAKKANNLLHSQDFSRKNKFCNYQSVFSGPLWVCETVCLADKKVSFLWIVQNWFCGLPDLCYSLLRKKYILEKYSYAASDIHSHSMKFFKDQINLIPG